MGMIHEKVRLRLGEQDKEVNALIDTGASHTFIRRDIADEMKLPKIAIDGKVTLGDGKTVPIQGYGLVIMELQGCEIPLNVMIKEDLPDQLILGADFLQNVDADIDMRDDKMIIRKCGLKQMRSGYLVMQNA